MSDNAVVDFPMLLNLARWCIMGFIVKDENNWRNVRWYQIAKCRNLPTFLVVVLNAACPEKTSECDKLSVAD